MALLAVAALGVTLLLDNPSQPRLPLLPERGRLLPNLVQLFGADDVEEERFEKLRDYPEFAPLVATGAQTFDIAKVSADKAYIGRSNLAAVAAIGAEAFIPFRKGLKDDPKSPLWSKMFHLYNYRVDEFLPYYHKRSNAEIFDDEAGLHGQHPGAGTLDL